MKGLGHSRHVRSKSAHVRFDQCAHSPAPVDSKKEGFDFGCCFDSLESHEKLSGSKLAVNVFQVVALVDHLLYDILVLCVWVRLVQRLGWPFEGTSRCDWILWMRNT